jgi:hypothetical protein
MQLRVSPSEAKERGLPGIGIALDGEGFTPLVFPRRNTIASLVGDIEGLPCVHLRAARPLVPDLDALHGLMAGHFGGELVAATLAPGGDGEVEVLGARRPAVAFYGRSRRGASVAGCLAAIPIESADLTLLVLMGVLGTPKIRPTPEAIVSHPQIADVLASLELELSLSPAAPSI